MMFHRQNLLFFAIGLNDDKISEGYDPLTNLILKNIRATIITFLQEFIYPCGANKLKLFFEEDLMDERQRTRDDGR